MQTTVMSRTRPTIHIHSDNMYNTGQSQFLGSRKRKRSSNYSSEDDDIGIPYIYPPTTSPIKSTSLSGEDDSETDHKAKRARRALNIEKGMGGMSLSTHREYVRPYQVEVSGHPEPAKSSYNYLNMHNVSEPEHLEIDEDYRIRDDHLDDDLDEILTPNVEEVVSPIVRISGGVNQRLNPRQLDEDDAKMRTASWYEPEKDRESHSANRVGRDIDQASIHPHRTGIVITDLSDSETEQEDGNTPPDGYSYWDNGDSQPGYTVSPAYLQRFGGIPKPSIPAKEPENTMALVAYRPVPYLPVRLDRIGEVETPTVRTVDESDAMDIDE